MRGYKRGCCFFGERRNVTIGRLVYISSFLHVYDTTSYASRFEINEKFAKKEKREKRQQLFVLLIEDSSFFSRGYE